MKNRIKIAALIILIVLINVGADQLTKDYARKHIQGQGTIKVIDSFFILVYAENTGAFLGMGGDLPQPFRMILLILLPVVIIGGALVYLIYHKKFTLLQLICIASVIGGGIGNLIDRITRNGAVTDFMNFGIGPVRTGVLNVADLSITFGAVILFIIEFRSQAKK